jgi:hypothetical protein
VIGRSGQARLVLLAAAGLLSAGLTACTSPKQLTACTAQLSSPTPVAGSTQTVTIKTAPGATVVAQAPNPTGNPYRTTTADAFGIARVSYVVGAPTPGQAVMVTIGVKKNGVPGSCSNGFVPQPKPTLHAASFAVRWVVPALPHGAGACGPGHTSACGTIFASVLVSGFSQFGGTPTCANSDVNTCRNDPGAVLSGQLSLSFAVSCPATRTTDTRSDVPVQLAPEPGAFNYKVTPVTRVDADTARVELSADLPIAGDVASCSRTPTLLQLNVTNLAFRLIGGGYPTAYFNTVGPFTATNLSH